MGTPCAPQEKKNKMAVKRMFYSGVTETDAFGLMPLGAQGFYLQLCLHADDEGFVSNLRMLRKMYRASERHLVKLAEEGFVHIFKSGVALIMHWHKHNSIKSELIKQSDCIAEKAEVSLNKKSGLYEISERCLADERLASLGSDSACEGGGAQKNGKHAGASSSAVSAYGRTDKKDGFSEAACAAALGINFPESAVKTEINANICAQNNTFSHKNDEKQGALRPLLGYIPEAYKCGAAVPLCHDEADGNPHKYGSDLTGGSATEYLPCSADEKAPEREALIGFNVIADGMQSENGCEHKANGNSEKDVISGAREDREDKMRDGRHADKGVISSEGKTAAGTEKDAAPDALVSKYAEGSAELAELLGSWLKLRRSKKGSMLPLIIGLNLEKLTEYAEQSEISREDYVKEILRRGWRDFYPLKTTLGERNTVFEKKETPAKRYGDFDVKEAFEAALARSNSDG